jgi:hypothetical protein
LKTNSFGPLEIEVSDFLDYLNVINPCNSKIRFQKEDQVACHWYRPKRKEIILSPLAVPTVVTPTYDPVVMDAKKFYLHILQIYKEGGNMNSLHVCAVQNASF